MGRRQKEGVPTVDELIQHSSVRMLIGLIEEFAAKRGTKIVVKLEVASFMAAETTEIAGKGDGVVRERKPGKKRVESKPKGDFCDEDGAKKLMRKIKDNWGPEYDTSTMRIVAKEFVPAMRSCRWEIETPGWINGMPPKKKVERNEAGRRPTPPKYTPVQPVVVPFAIRDNAIRRNGGN